MRNFRPTRAVFRRAAIQLQLGDSDSKSVLLADELWDIMTTPRTEGGRKARDLCEAAEVAARAYAATGDASHLEEVRDAVAAGVGLGRELAERAAL